MATQATVISMIKRITSGQVPTLENLPEGYIAFGLMASDSKYHIYGSISGQIIDLVSMPSEMVWSSISSGNLVQSIVDGLNNQSEESVLISPRLLHQVVSEIYLDLKSKIDACNARLDSLPTFGSLATKDYISDSDIMPGAEIQKDKLAYDVRLAIDRAGNGVSMDDLEDLNALIQTRSGLPSWDAHQFILTFTSLSGASVSVDIPLASIGVNYNPETKTIEFLGPDGNVTSTADISELLNEYSGSIGNDINVYVSTNNVISASLRAGSVDEENLSLSLKDRLNQIEMEAARSLKEYVNADWEAVNGPARILNKPPLGDLAFVDIVELIHLSQGIVSELAKLSGTGYDNTVISEHLQPYEETVWKAVSKLQKQITAAISDFNTSITNTNTTLSTEITRLTNEFNQRIESLRTQTDTRFETALGRITVTENRLDTNDTNISVIRADILNLMNQNEISMDDVRAYVDNKVSVHDETATAHEDIRNDIMYISNFINSAAGLELGGSNDVISVTRFDSLLVVLTKIINALNAHNVNQTAHQNMVVDARTET